MTAPARTLLPPNATPLERALEAVTARISKIPMPLPTLWNPMTCPVSDLPWLAYALRVEDWDPSWSEEVKRAALAAAPFVQKHKGTLAAIETALAAVGHPDAEVIERADMALRNGTMHRDGTRHRAGGGHWATFRVVLKRPVTVDQAEHIRMRIESVKRKCCHLIGFDFTKAALRRNGTITRNGQYARGLAK